MLMDWPGVNWAFSGSKKLVSTKEARFDVRRESGGLLTVLGVGRRGTSSFSFSAELGWLDGLLLLGDSLAGDASWVREPVKLWRLLANDNRELLNHIREC